MRVPLFRERHGWPRPRHGPLLGHAVLVAVAPTECDARAVRTLARRLRRLGVRVGVTMECHGEARGEDGTPLFPDCLLIEAGPGPWDALVLAGGRGARRVAEDAQARALLLGFTAQHKPVAALGAGRDVLAAAKVTGPSADDPRALAAELAVRLALTPLRSNLQ